ncbi:MAG: metalloregulator ArsR/SmtB family transcription factor [Phycisphaerales bacterium]
MSRIPADASVFHAIADPTRRAILDLLREGEKTVSAMLDAVAKAFRITQSGFSQHLAVLRRAGLVLVEKRGRMRVYSLRADPLNEVSQWIGAYDRFWTDRLDKLGTYLDRRHGRATKKEKP